MAMAAPRPEPPPAARGGSRGYTPGMRQSQLALAAAGAPGVVASETSLWRWATHGTGRCVKRGGAIATSLRGEEELLLVLCRLAWPKATADQISAYIARNSTSGWIYSRVAITRCENRLGLTRKRGSTTAFQALTPFNQARRHNFWNLRALKPGAGVITRGVRIALARARHVLCVRCLLGRDGGPVEASLGGASASGGVSPCLP